MFLGQSHYYKIQQIIQSLYFQFSSKNNHVNIFACLMYESLETALSLFIIFFVVRCEYNISLRCVFITFYFDIYFWVSIWLV